MAYNVAFAAHANCARALTEALMRGDEDTETLVEAELRPAVRKKRHAKSCTQRWRGRSARLIEPPTEKLLR